MLAQRSMYDSAVEKNFGGVGDVVKDLQRLLKFVVVVMGERLHPCLNFLPTVSRLDLVMYDGFAFRTCFKDMSEQLVVSFSCPNSFLPSSHWFVLKDLGLWRLRSTLDAVCGSTYA
jgi:hypothetical protein